MLQAEMKRRREGEGEGEGEREREGRRSPGARRRSQSLSFLLATPRDAGGNRTGPSKAVAVPTVLSQT